MAAAAAAPTAAKSNSEFEGTQYSFADSLAATVPEIKTLIAEASAGGWDTTRFADALQTTKWWKANSDSARSVIALKANDPAEYVQQAGQARQHIIAMSAQLGVKLSGAQLQQQIDADMFQGFDDTALQQSLTSLYNGTSTGGTSADVQQSLKQLASSYGVPVTQAWLNQWTKNALTTGDTQLTGATQSLVATAKSTYPSLAAQLDSGQTVDQIADPYKAQMASVLEIPETSIDLTDKTIQKALTNPNPAPAAGGAPSTAPGQTVMPLWQFTDSLKQDPRWQQTDNAKQTAYSLVAGLGKQFGFAS